MRAALKVAVLATALGLAGHPALSEDPPRLGAHGLRLPATFTGTLPCADCQGIDVHLDLWPDQSFALRREWIGGREPLIEDALGRWHVDPSRAALILDGLGDAPALWAITGPASLRALGRDGRPAPSGLSYALAGGPLGPTALDLTVRGLFSYFADAARFVECGSGQDLPVATEAAYPVIEDAYLSARTGPRAPVLFEVAGRIEMRPAMEGLPRRVLIVDAVLAAHPEETCLQDLSPPRLTNTIWRVLSLRDRALTVHPDRPEPHLLLLDNRRFAATLGCNRLAGKVETSGADLRFAAIATTRMACPEPLMADESILIEALEATVSLARSDGRRLVLLGADGSALAELEAAYVPP